MDRPRVGGGLQQGREPTWLIIADLDGCRFQANVVRVGQVEGLPPSLIAAFPGESGEILAPCCILDTVDRTQIPDIPGAGASLACLQPTDLRRRAFQPLGNLLNCESRLVPERT